MPHPRGETVFVFGLAIVAAVVIGIGLGGGLGQRPSGLKLARSAQTGPTTAVVAQIPSDTPPALGRTRHGVAGSATRHTSRGRRSAAERAAAKRAAAMRAAARRRAAKRKAAAARGRRRQSHSPQRAVVVRIRSVSPAPRAATPPPAPSSRTAPVRSAPKAQPAPPVQFNETGTNPSPDSGTVQFDQSGSGSGSAPAP